MERTLRTSIPGPDVGLTAPTSDAPPAIGADGSDPSTEQASPRTALGIVLTALGGRPEDAASRRRRAHRERQAAEQAERLLCVGLHRLR